jgi:hypothetical protein
VKIEVDDTVTSTLVHRFRNFGEDVYRRLHDIAAVDIEEIDSSTSTFFVRHIRKRDLKTVIQIIGEELKSHNFGKFGEVDGRSAA